MKEENLEAKVRKVQPVAYEKIISDRLIRAERYKTNVLYAGIATAITAGAVSCALYYFIIN